MIADVPDFSAVVDNSEDTVVIDRSNTGLSLEGLFDFSSCDFASLEAFKYARLHWEVLGWGENTALHAERDALILRAHRMLGHWAWWSFIIQAVPVVVRDYVVRDVSPRESASHWVHTLASYIRSSIDRLPGPHTLMDVCDDDGTPRFRSHSMMSSPVKLRFKVCLLWRWRI